MGRTDAPAKDSWDERQVGNTDILHLFYHSCISFPNLHRMRSGRDLCTWLSPAAMWVALAKINSLSADLLLLLIVSEGGGQIRRPELNRRKAN